MEIICPTSIINQSLEQLKTKATKCTKCELSQTRTNVVFADGKAPCNIMLIGEAPGKDEDEQGIPFVGRSGKLLTKLLEDINLTRPNDIYITNTVKCRPPSNRNPKSSEIQNCNDYLISQIYQVKPRVLLLVGAPSMRTVLKTKTPISKIRGEWIEAKVGYMSAPLKIMVIFHPAYLLRNQSNKEGSPKWLTLQDLQKVEKYVSSK